MPRRIRMFGNEIFISHIDRQTLLNPALKAWKIFLDDQNKSKYTITSFEGDLKLLIKFLPPDKAIGEITTNDLNRFLDWIKNGRGMNIPCSPKSFSRRVTTLKSFFRWLQQNGRITIDPAEKILQQSVTSPLPEVLSQDEQILALAAAQNILENTPSDARPFALLQLLLATGIKKSECLNLKIQHIEKDSNEKQYIYIRYPSQKDRNKERKIDLNPLWLKVYDKYVDQYKIEDALFPWSPRRLEYILEDLGREAELSKHISFSMCRWSCTLNDWRQGLGHDQIRQKLGISKIQWREIKAKLERLDQLTPP